MTQIPLTYKDEEVKSIGSIGPDIYSVMYVDTSQLVNGWHVNLYKVINGELVPEDTNVVEQNNRKIAWEEKEAEIKELEDFKYSENILYDDHYYDVSREYVIEAYIATLDGVTTIMYKTEDKDTDNVTPIYDGFDLARFNLLNKAIKQRKIDIYNSAESKRNDLRLVYLDTNKTIADIENYDISF